MGVIDHSKFKSLDTGVLNHIMSDATSVSLVLQKLSFRKQRVCQFAPRLLVVM